MTPGKSAVAAALRNYVEACRRMLPSRTNQLHPCQGRGIALHHPTETPLSHRPLSKPSTDEPGGSACVARPSAPSLSADCPLLRRQCCSNKRPALVSTHWIVGACDSCLIAERGWRLSCSHPVTLPQSWGSLQDSEEHLHIPPEAETQAISITC